MPDGEPGPDGTLVLVVGPSGAGKDSLIDHARTVLGDRALFPRRIVTRLPSEAERHDTLAPEAFGAAAERGDFAVTWQAHGLSYALPGLVDHALRRGELVVCNVSRAIVPVLRRRYPKVVVIYVDAPLAVRMQRIVGRARPGEGAGRAERTHPFQPADADHIVDNGGRFDEAADRFMQALAACPV